MKFILIVGWMVAFVYGLTVKASLFPLCIGWTCQLSVPFVYAYVDGLVNRYV